MKTKPILVLFVISFLIFNQHCFSQDHQVDLMKVTNTTGTDHPDLPYWKAAGVSLTGRQDTYISIVSEPPRDQVKRVVFISAGQQSDNPMPWKDLLSSNYGEGYTNVLTGQPDNYKEGFRGANELEKKKWIDKRSLAAKLINSGKFPKESTLFVLAFDARFGYFRNQDEKGNRENAFFNLLTSKFDPSKVELIVLSGQSRGGALMFRLGSRLRSNSNYSKIPLIVQGYDPVATNPRLARLPNKTLRKTSIEKYLPINSENDIFKNPNDYNNKYCWKVDMDVTFPSDKRENLKVLNLHAGGEVGLHKSIRAFAWTGKNGEKDHWYKEWWLNYEHEEMGGCNNFKNVTCLSQTVEVGYEHIIYGMDGMEKEKDYNCVNGDAIKGLVSGDFNGDGKKDNAWVYYYGNNKTTIHTLLSDGTKFNYQGDSGWYSSNGINGNAIVKVVSGNFNNDQFDDIAWVYYYGNNKTTVHTFLSDGTKFNYQGNNGWYSSNGVNGSVIKDVVSGDFNNDKKDDIAWVYYYGRNKTTIHTLLSDGTKFNFQGSNGWYNSTGVNGNVIKGVVSGDFNNDKKDDIAWVYYYGKNKTTIHTFLSDGTKFNYQGNNGWYNSTGVNGDVIKGVVSGDFNNDKKDDIAWVYYYGNNKTTIHTLLSDGTKFNYQGNYGWYNSSGINGDVIKGVVSGDFNNDQKDDIGWAYYYGKNNTAIHTFISNGLKLNYQGDKGWWSCKK